MVFDHLNLVVRDMERARRFYGDALGLRQTFERVLEGAWIETVTGVPGAVARCVFFEAQSGEVRLELLQYLQPLPDRAALHAAALDAAALDAAAPDAATAGFRHIAFNVHDIDEWFHRLHSQGIEFVSPPVTVPFAVGGKTKRLCYFRDPENNILELAEYSGA